MIKYFSISKYILWIFYAILLLALILSLGVSWFSSNSGKTYIQSLIHEKLSQEIGYQIETENIRFNFPITVTLSKISLADTQGKWLEADNLSFSIPIIPIIKKHFIIGNISADQIQLLRFPSIYKKTSTSKQANEQNIKISVLIKDIKKIIISENVTNANKDIESSLKGSFHWKGLDNCLTFQSNSTVNNLTQNLKSLDISLSGVYEKSTEDINIDFTQTLNNLSKIQGNAKLNLKSNNILANAKLENLVLGEWIEGSVGSGDAEIKVNGTIKDLSVKAIGKSYDFSYKNKNIPDFIVTMNGFLSNKNWFGDMSVEAKDISKTELSYNYIASEHSLKLSNINAGYLENYVKGNLNLNLDTMLMDGKLDAKILFIEQFANYLPEEIKGRADISAVLSNKQKAQAINTNIKLENLIIREANISKADIALNISNLNLAEPELVEANFLGIKYKDFIIKKANISVFHRLNNLDINIQADGNNNSESFDLSSSGRLTIDKKTTNKEISLILNLFKGSYGKNKFISSDKITFFSKNTFQSLIIPKLNIGNGEFSLNAKITKEKKIDLTVHGKHIFLEMLKRDLPEGLTGQYLSFNLNLIGSLNNPELYSDLSFYNKEARKINNITIQIKEEQALLNVKSENQTSEYYNLQASIPVNFSLDPSLILSIKETSLVQGKLNYNFDVSTISNIIMSPDHSIKGRASGDLTISGTYLKPLINGKLKYSEGAYNYLSLGLNFYNIDTLISAKNNIFTIDKLRAKDLKNNQLEIKGQANFGDINSYIYDLKLNIKNFNLFNNSNIYSVISGAISMKGNNKSGKIEGSLNSEELNIYLPARFTKDIPSLNITEASIKSKNTDSKPLNYSIFLDIILQAKNKVFIHGWGVDAELHGKLELKGSIDKPQIKGKLSTIRGSYEEFGKKFKLKTAELLFEGDIPPSPYLNIIGSITKLDLEIMPIISGPLLNPSLSIESSPEKPQEEILSILLFGKDSSKISAFQAIQLGSSLKRISTGQDSGFDPLRKIRDTFGLDEITVNDNQDTSSSPSLGVAKYISDSVRVKVDQGEEAKDGRVGLEVDLTPNVSIESGSSGSGNNGIGLNWKYNY